jgi:hypothetical protein
MNNQLWGPITWTLFHVLIEKTKEDSMPYIKHILIHIITIICKALPCPTCREHASTLLEKYKHYQVLTSKTQLKNWLLGFHNVVNKKLNKPEFTYSQLEYYKRFHLNELVPLWQKHFIIMNHDLQVLIDKQNIARTKNTVIKLLAVHRKHFT